MRALIDGDIIRYSVGFAAQGEPIENCLHSVKIMIQSIVTNTHSTDYTVYLSGSSNFRDGIATIREYKGTRVSAKPDHYDDITEYLLKYHHAVVVEGEEADDAMGITQCSRSGEEPTVIASIDKDMDMIPGWHYNWPHHGKKERMYWIKEREALRNFYRQLLTGDRVDNIEGVQGVGPKTADRILHQHGNDEDLFWATLCEYEKVYPKPYDVMLENARLLWIRRKKDEMWEMPY